MMARKEQSKDDSIKRFSSVLERVGDKNYLIPRHQRPFEWRATDHIRDLVDDIIHAASSGEKHFFGTFYLQAGRQTEAILQDGQQRVTSLKCLLTAEYLCKTLLGSNDSAGQQGVLAGEKCRGEFDKIHTKLVNFTKCAEKMVMAVEKWCNEMHQNLIVVK